MWVQDGRPVLFAFLEDSHERLAEFVALVDTIAEAKISTFLSQVVPEICLKVVKSFQRFAKSWNSWNLKCSGGVQLFVDFSCNFWGFHDLKRFFALHPFSG